ncbi:MAG TPA: 50S ribosomal protein L32e [Thermoplasmata archaeon]|nr:50S ribosomal protein L32e [Thermoplasmata archaeon]
MAEETPETATPPAEPEPAPKKARTRAKKAETPSEPEKKVEKEGATESKKPEGPQVPRRAELAPELKGLLLARREMSGRRPIFGRQAAHRYYRIGRDGTWRRPRGLQSKQRRHYGYRAKIVRIGYRSPARVRGLVPSGFEPRVVSTSKELERLDAKRHAAIIARTVGTRRRLVLEEEARKLGIRVLNPIVKSETEA